MYPQGAQPPSEFEQLFWEFEPVTGGGGGGGGGAGLQFLPGQGLGLGQSLPAHGFASGLGAASRLPKKSLDNLLCGFSPLCFSADRRAAIFWS
jgi:hypothetical protein